MKAYKIHYHHPDVGCQLAWASSKDAAKRALASIIEDHEGFDVEPYGIELINIPTDRTGLIGWLNMHVDSDNG